MARTGRAAAKPIIFSRAIAGLRLACCRAGHFGPTPLALPILRAVEGEAKAAPSRREQPGQRYIETSGEQGARRIAQSHHRIRRRRPREILELATGPVNWGLVGKAAPQSINERILVGDATVAFLHDFK